MRTTAIVCATAALLPWAPGSRAATVPAQLYNKTISISLSVSADAVAEDGTRTSRPRQVQRTIYVSSKGRIFSRVDRQVGRRGETVERTPEQTSGAFRFEGNRLVGVNVNFPSGAAQLTITFDSSFQSCTASIAFGREGGKAFKFKGLDGKTYTTTGVPTATTPSCSIREGNPFAQ
jgi:hypothetical protein